MALRYAVKIEIFDFQDTGNIFICFGESKSCLIAFFDESGLLKSILSKFRVLKARENSPQMGLILAKSGPEWSAS